VRQRSLLLIFVSLGVLLAACGGSSKPSSGASTTTTPAATSPGGSPTTAHIAKEASNVPSVSAKMICESEAQKDIYESATGVKTIAPFKPTWVGHVYSCVYKYPGGAQMTLSVKELSSPDETTAYFDSLATKLHKTTDQAGVGQGAFHVANGSIVVRKDYKVLLIDVSKLPASFGVPADQRADVATNVAVTIMGCWTGA
jgi:hypothetical protein